MTTKFVILNAPVDVLVEEVVCGCEFRLGLYVEEVLNESANPYDFSDVEFLADVRRDHDDPQVLETFTIAARQSDPGWIDLLLDGDQTTTLGQWDFVSSVKVWPTGLPEQATTLITLRLPLRIRASR